jgi:hypothetical protein
MYRSARGASEPSVRDIDGLGTQAVLQSRHIRMFSADLYPWIGRHRDSVVRSRSALQCRATTATPARDELSDNDGVALWTRAD